MSIWSLDKEQVSWNEQVRKRGLPPPMLGLDERGQAPLPDLFISDLFIPTDWLISDLFISEGLLMSSEKRRGKS